MPIDVYRGTAGNVLPVTVSNDIWQATQEQSGVMAASNRIDLPGAGLQIPIVTGDPTPTWVGETDEITVSRPTLGSKTMQGYKTAFITPFSNEFRRDSTAIYNTLVSRMPLRLAQFFDTTVFGLPYGTTGTTVPGSNFDALGNAAVVGINGKTYSGLVAAQAAVANGTYLDGELTGWVLSPAGKSVLQGAVDSANRPIFFPNALGSNGVPDIFGSPVLTSRGVYRADADGPGAGTDKQYGYAGDWRQAFYGIVSDIEISITDQGTINDNGTLIHLFQRDMFAVKITATFGFRVRDLSYFVKLTSAVQS